MECAQAAHTWGSASGVLMPSRQGRAAIANTGASAPICWAIAEVSSAVLPIAQADLRRPHPENPVL
jgi:hypothetical protein